MQDLVYSYNPALLLASVAVSMMAAFTGLSLTRGISTLGTGQRQMRIAMAAVALGGGIWSMHFVAILAMRFEVPVGFEPLRTFGSALLAILLAGLSLLIMHYGARSVRNFALSGTALGVGIVTMHFVGMSGLEHVVPVYGRAGVAIAGAMAVVMGVLAIAVAYGDRTQRNIVLGTLIFGSSVVVVHFVAMANTSFLPAPGDAPATPGLENAELALLVMFAAFLICGAFLLSGATFVVDASPAAANAAPRGNAEPSSAPAEAAVRIPVEQGGQISLLPPASVAAIRAEGHYSIAYAGERKLLCPWSISEAERRLGEGSFVRVHRSYLVNLAHVTGFERRKDNGVCLLEETPAVPKVPVSRARIGAVRAALGV